VRQVNVFAKTANSMQVTYKSDPPNSSENKISLGEDSS
jgi:hypothetical protein